MWIESIKLKGFRSFRDETVITFDPHHTAVIGRNGSGKSNLVLALLYVLQPKKRAYLRPQLLQYEQTDGAKLMSAEIELNINNEDKRFLTLPEKIKVLCILNQKTDILIVNGKNYNLTGWNDLLRGAGLQRENYFVVAQGEISQLAMKSPPERLQMLCEFAGQGEYIKKNKQSCELLLKSRKDQEMAHEKIDLLEASIEDMAVQLEELNVYLKLDRQKRAIDLVLTERELTTLSEKLKHLRETRNETELQELAVKLNEVTKEQKSLESKLKKKEAEIGNRVVETEFLRESYESQLTEMHKIKETTQSCRQVLERNDSEQREVANLLAQIEQEKAELEEILAEKEADLAEKTDRFEELERNVNERNQQLKFYYEKQGRRSFFATDEERQHWLNENLAALNQDIQSNQGLLKDLESKWENLRSQKAALEDGTEAKLKEVDELKSQKDNLEIQRSQYAQDWSTLAMELKILQTRKMTAQQAALAEQVALQESLQKLRSKPYLKNFIDGILSIKKVLNHLERENVDQWVADGYLGSVAQNITCNKDVNLAVSVTAGNRLFYHIVKSKHVVQRLIHWINHLQLPGEVFFLPLDTLQYFPPTYPESKDTKPLLSLIKYPEEAKLAFDFVFGRTLLLRNEDAKNVIRGHKVDGILLDGTQFSSKGTLTGGYYRESETKLSLFKEWENQCLSSLEKQRSVEEFEAQINERQNGFQAAQDQMTKLDVKLDRVIKNIGEALAACSLDQKRILDLEKAIASLSEAVAKRESIIEELKYKAKQLSDELEGNLDSNSQEEVEQMERIIKELELLRKNLRKMTKKRAKAAKARDAAKNELNEKVVRKLEEAQAKKGDLVNESKRIRNDCLTNADKISLLQNAVKESEQNLETNSKYIDEEKLQLQADQKELQKISSVQTKIEEAHQKALLDTDKSSSKERGLLQQIEDCKARLMNSRVPESMGKYQERSNKLLKKALVKVNHELAKYDSVNVSAKLQYDKLVEERKHCLEMLKDCEEGLQKNEIINEKLESVQHDKIDFTFRQVQKYFEEIFSILVPSGKGRIKFERPTVDSQDAASLKFYVAFHEGEEEVSDLNHLSGGQKSVVALAYMFALQKCDPSPIYVFDEIDACLDPKSRRRVAKWLKFTKENNQPSSPEEDSNVEEEEQPRPMEPPQFITITFRKELVEHADKIIGLSMPNTVSKTQVLTKEKALDFIASYVPQ